MLRRSIKKETPPARLIFKPIVFSNSPVEEAGGIHSAYIYITQLHVQNLNALEKLTYDAFSNAANDTARHEDELHPVENVEVSVQNVEMFSAPLAPRPGGGRRKRTSEAKRRVKKKGEPVATH